MMATSRHLCRFEPRLVAFAVAAVLHMAISPTTLASNRFESTPAVDSQPDCRWSTDFNLPGFDGTVLTSLFWDDGTGPTLYVGGEFQFHGKKPMPFAARWNGLEWEALIHPNGVGVDGPVRQLLVYDDGTGEALYAGGDFASAGGEILNGVARWDGRRWWSLIGNDGVGLDDGSFAAMAVHDFGYGNVIAVGGKFETAGGEPVNNIAQWNGDRWQAVSWIGGTGIDDQITTMAVAMDRLFVVHEARQGYSVRASLSYWDRVWVPVDGFNASPGRVSMVAHDDGSGEALYVAEVNRWDTPRRWNGTEWSSVVDGEGRGLSEFLEYPSIGPFITTLATIDLGDGPVLTLGGVYCWRFDGMNCIDSMFIAQWDGEWQVHTDESEGLVASATVATMTTIEDQSGRSLIVGGWNLADNASILGAVGRWDQTSWSAAGRGEGSGMAGSRWPEIASMASFDEGSGPALFAAGSFTIAGDTAAVGIARLRDGEWSALNDDQGNGSCAALGCELRVKLASLEDSPGTALHAVSTVQCSERYTSIDVATWDGTDWSHRNSTGCFYNYVHDVAVFEDGAGPAIYGSGLFASWNETLMKFNGSGWERLPGSGGYPPGGEAKILEAWNEGAGKGLYVAGDFLEMGGLQTRGFARWDGSRWSVPEGPSGVRLTSGSLIRDMVVFDDGTGEALFVGGASLTDGPSSLGVVKWDGERWWRLHNSPAERPPGTVAALAVFDDGNGPRLYAATNKQVYPEGFISTVSRWDGDVWTIVGHWSSSDDDWQYLEVLFTHDDGDGPSLYLGGRFTEFAGVISHGIAGYSCRPPSYGAGAVRRSGPQVQP